MGLQTPRIGHLAFNALDTYLLLDQPERRAHIRLCSMNSQTFALVSQRHKIRPSGGPAVYKLFGIQVQYYTELDLQNPHLLQSTSTCYSLNLTE